MIPISCNAQRRHEWREQTSECGDLLVGSHVVTTTQVSGCSHSRWSALVNLLQSVSKKRPNRG